VKRLLVIALLAGCGRCGEARPPRVVQTAAIDVRTALFTALPEFRGLDLREARASVERELEWSLPAGKSLPEALEPSYAERSLPEGSPFRRYAEAEGARIRVGIAMQIKPEQIPDLLHAVAPIGSEGLSAMLPTPPGARVLRDTFVLAVEYRARDLKPARALIEGLTRTEWRAQALPPGWPELPPARFELVLLKTHGDTRLKLLRDRERFRVELVQPLGPQAR
jgi:hypothetical protein